MEPCCHLHVAWLPNCGIELRKNQPAKLRLEARTCRKVSPKGVLLQRTPVVSGDRKCWQVQLMPRVRQVRSRVKDRTRNQDRWDGQPVWNHCRSHRFPATRGYCFKSLHCFEAEAYDAQRADLTNEINSTFNYWRSSKCCWSNSQPVFLFRRFHCSQPF